MQPKGAGLFLILLIVLAVTMFMGVALAQQIAPTPDPLALTATEIVVRATKAQSILGIPTPDMTASHIWSAYAATRTAIAVTRQPELAHTSLPNTLELTATQIMSQYNLTATSRFQEGTPDYQATSTVIIQWATETSFALTQNPALALTRLPSPTLLPRVPWLGNLYDRETSEELQRSLEEAGMETIIANVVSVAIWDCDQSCKYSDYLATAISLQMEVADIEDEEQLTKQVEEILATLVASPLLTPYMRETTWLTIGFSDGYKIMVPRYRFIQTGYNNAVQAYVIEGLRGEALIEALGTFSPLR